MINPFFTSFMGSQNTAPAPQPPPPDPVQIRAAQRQQLIKTAAIVGGIGLIGLVVFNLVKK